MLEVVEHEQECALMEEAHQLLHRRQIIAVPQTDCVGDGRHDQRWIADASEVNPDHPVGEVLSNIMHKPLREASLADAARTGQRQEGDRLIQQQFTGAGEFRLPADEAGARDGDGAEER